MNTINKQNVSVTVVFLASNHARNSTGKTREPNSGDVKF